MDDNARLCGEDEYQLALGVCIRRRDRSAEGVEGGGGDWGQGGTDGRVRGCGGYLEAEHRLFGVPR